MVTKIPNHYPIANSNFFQTSSPKYLLLVKCQFILLPKSSSGFHHTYTNTEINGASLQSICMYLRQLAHSNPTYKIMAGSLKEIRVGYWVMIWNFGNHLGLGIK